MKILFFALIFLFHGYAESIYIPPGSTAKWVSSHLKSEGIISSAHLFYIHLRTNKLSTKLHSGDFEIPKGSSYKKISDILTGKTPQFIAITIPEGFTIQEIVSRLESKKVISSAKEFLAFIQKKKINNN